MSAVQLSCPIQSPLPLVVEAPISCWESAKKVQEISGHAFSRLTKFYYLLVDLFARCFAFVKQKQIVEVTLLSAIYEKKKLLAELVNKNFSVIASNVLHISDADVICLGELHNRVDHRVKNGELIDALCDEGKDLILKEYDERKPPESLVEFQMKDLKHKELKVKGWDLRDQELDAQFFNNFVVFDDAVKVMNQKKGECKIAAGLFVLSSLGVVIGVVPPISIVGLAALMGLSSYEVYKGSKRVIEAGEQVNLGHRKTSVEFPLRNRHMCQVVHENAPSSRKIFVIAGQYHFMIPERTSIDTQTEWYNKYIVTFSETVKSLKNKKFIMLVPKK
jgi:hypothetical protein